MQNEMGLGLCMWVMPMLYQNWSVHTSCCINTVLWPIKVNTNTIELIVHTSCYCILDLLCYQIFKRFVELKLTFWIDLCISGRLCWRQSHGDYQPGTGSCSSLARASSSGWRTQVQASRHKWLVQVRHFRAGSEHRNESAEVLKKDSYEMLAMGICNFGAIDKKSFLHLSFSARTWTWYFHLKIKMWILFLT